MLEYLRLSISSGIAQKKNLVDISMSRFQQQQVFQYKMFSAGWV